MGNTALRILALAGLAASGSASAGTIFAINDSSNSLVTIDPTTYAVTTVGSLGTSGDFGDLTYNPTNNSLYWVAGRGNNNLYTVNQTTGAATLIGSHGINDLFGLAYDGALGKLFAQSTNGSVYTLDANTGAATLIGSNSVYPGGLTYNASTNQLLELGAGSGSVYEINTATGAATLLASGTFINDNGFAYDSDHNVYWADDWSANLYKFDAAFSRTTVANLGAAYDGIVYVASGGNNVPEPGGMALVSIAFLGLAASRRKKA